MHRNGINSNRVYEKLVQKKKSKIQKYIALWSFRWKKSCLSNILNLIYSSVNIYLLHFVILFYLFFFSFHRKKHKASLENLQREKLLVQKPTGDLWYFVSVGRSLCFFFLDTLFGFHTWSFKPTHTHTHTHTFTHTHTLSLSYTHIFAHNLSVSARGGRLIIRNIIRLLFFSRLLCFFVMSFFALFTERDSLSSTWSSGWWRRRSRVQTII